VDGVSRGLGPLRPDDAAPARASSRTEFRPKPPNALAPARPPFHGEDEAAALSSHRPRSGGERLCCRSSDFWPPWGFVSEDGVDDRKEFSTPGDGGDPFWACLRRSCERSPPRRSGRSWPACRAPARVPTWAGLTTTTGRPAPVSAAATTISKPPVASTAIRAGASALSWLTRSSSPAPVRAVEKAAAIGCACATNRSFDTSTPT
jgi:hypothetical protein